MTFVLHSLATAVLIIAVLATWMVWTQSSAKASAVPDPQIRHLVQSVINGQRAQFRLRAAFACVLVLLLSLAKMLVRHDEWEAVFMGLFGTIPVLRPFFAAGLLRQAARNNARVFGGAPPAGRFVLYLRDRQEEDREMLTGPPEQQRFAPLQRGAERLKSALSSVRIYGFWDPNDRRTGLPFEPLLAEEQSWRSRVVALCERATVIVADIAHESQSLQWELAKLASSPALLSKTLIIRAEGDPDPSLTADAVIRDARWRVVIDDRGEEGSSDPLILPLDLRTLLGVRSARHRA